MSECLRKFGKIVIPTSNPQFPDEEYLPEEGSTPKTRRRTNRERFSKERRRELREELLERHA